MTLIIKRGRAYIVRQRDIDAPLIPKWLAQAALVVVSCALWYGIAWVAMAVWPEAWR